MRVGLLPWVALLSICFACASRGTGGGSLPDALWSDAAVGKDRDGSVAVDGSSAAFSVEDISPSNPSGTFNGAAWTMQSAIVTERDGELSVSLYSDRIDDCADVQPTGPAVLFSLPAVVAEYRLFLKDDLSAGQTVTFYTPPSDNEIVVDGLIVLRSLSESSVTLGLIAQLDGDTINGTVSTTLCPAPF